MCCGPRFATPTVTIVPEVLIHWCAIRKTRGNALCGNCNLTWQFWNTMRFARCVELNSRLSQHVFSSTIILRTSFAILRTSFILLSQHFQRQIMVNLARLNLGNCVTLHVYLAQLILHSQRRVRTAARTLRCLERGHIIFWPHLILHPETRKPSSSTLNSWLLVMPIVRVGTWNRFHVHWCSREHNVTCDKTPIWKNNH